MPHPIRLRLALGGYYGSNVKTNGNRGRVTGHNDEWFKAEPRQDLEKALLALIQREWKMTLVKLTKLFDPEE